MTKLDMNKVVTDSTSVRSFLYGFFFITHTRIYFKTCVKYSFITYFKFFVFILNFYSKEEI